MKRINEYATGAADERPWGRWVVLATGDTAFIPAGARHRVLSTGNLPLRFIEVQTGDYLSEDDIQRYDDRYGRTK